VIHACAHPLSLTVLIRILKLSTVFVQAYLHLIEHTCMYAQFASTTATKVQGSPFDTTRDSPASSLFIFLAHPLSLQLLCLLLAHPPLLVCLPSYLLLDSFGRFFMLEPLSCLLSGIHPRANTVFQTRLNKVCVCLVNFSCYISTIRQGFDFLRHNAVCLLISYDECARKTNSYRSKAEKNK
jgi:hypothetical protein